MTFDVFHLRDTVVGEYRDYFESFVHIDDPHVRAYVSQKLCEGEPWPDAVRIALAGAYRDLQNLDHGSIKPCE